MYINRFSILVVMLGLLIGGRAYSANILIENRDSISPSSEQLLSKMVTAIKKGEALELNFNMTAVSDKGAVIGSFSGVVCAQGYAFKLENPQLEIYCDGDSKWIYNIDEKEVTIFPNDTSQVDLIENPIGFLLSLGSSDAQFKYPNRARETKSSTDSKKLWSIELTPKSKYSPYKSLSICIDKSSYLPVMLMYRSSDDSSYTISISSFNYMPLWPISYFTFPQTKLKRANVTDLR